jgi:hypothetical protein
MKKSDLPPERRPVPVLEGWTSLPAAAELLSVTRQRVYQMGVEENSLDSLRQVPGAGQRPAAYVVGDTELCRLRRTQLQAQLAAATASGEDDRVEQLEASLAEVQLDAVRQLQVQLAMAADAADVAGDVKLATLLRKRSPVPVAGCPVCQGHSGEVNVPPERFCTAHKPASVGADA